MSRGSAPSRLSYPPCRVLRHQIVQILMPNIIPPHFTSQLRARAWARAPGTFCRYWNIFERWKMCCVLSGWNLSSSATIWSILGHKNFTRWIIFLRFIAPYLSLQHCHKKTQQSQCLSTFHFKIPSSCAIFLIMKKQKLLLLTKSCHQTYYTINSRNCKSGLKFFCLKAFYSVTIA